MKKLLKIFCTVALISVLAFSLSGCGETATVKNAFKNAGYEITNVEPDDSDELKALLKTDEQKKDIEKYKVFRCKHFERTATVVIFPSEKTLKEVLGETTFNSKTKDGYIKGSCYLVKSCTDAYYIFKNA